MKRRTAIKQVAFTLGGLMTLPIWAKAWSATDVQSQPFLTATQDTLLAELVETVIPETNSPFGALISTTPTRAPSKTNAMTTTTPTTNQPSLSLVTTNTPSSVSSPATLYRVSLTSFSIAATNVQSLQQFQSTMSQYMLSAMMGQLSSSVVRLVDLEAAAVPTTRRRRRRRLQQQQEMMVVYSFIGSVLMLID